MSVESLKARCRELLSPLDGGIVLSGLHEPVEILRDSWGVPHIYARNQDDLFVAQGFVAAQDRLFQIDFWRRLAVGETAEILGREGLEIDRFARLAKYRGDWDAEWQSYGDDARGIATAFTRGINAYIDHVGDRLPIEFEVLGCRPKHWQPEDCLGRMSGIIMVRNFLYEVYRARLIAAVGVEKSRQLAPTDPRSDFAPAEGLDFEGIDPKALLASYLAATGPLPFADRALATRSVGEAPTPRRIRGDRPPLAQASGYETTDDGSNNWVVDGSRSLSAGPLLASDPHRTIAMPSLRYLVHLNAPGWNVIGSGEPALPGVAIGHNDRVAWGFTIVCTDQADLYVEELHLDDPTRYRVGDDWAPMTILKELVSVRGEREPVELELRFTRHGPVLFQDDSRHRAYALRWAGSEPGAAAYLGSLALDRARNWEEFREALRRWKMPSENVVYADVDGNVGWVAAALTPVRENSDGVLPVPGAGGEHEWTRFLDLEELPQSFNPPEAIATANHNITPPGYAHTIAYDWAPPYRYERIRERLNEKRKFDLEDFKQLQHDNVSLAGRSLARLAGRFQCDDPKLESVRQKFAEWNGELARGSRMGPVYGYWLQELLSTVFSPHLPEDLREFFGGYRGVPPMLEALEHPTEAWFGGDPLAACNTLLAQTFAAAVESVEGTLGPDLNAWRWDGLHSVAFRHPLSALGRDYASVFDRGPVGQGGDGFCPNATRYEEPFAQISGASYRHLFDLSDWDRGLATSAPGQSGQPESPHYDDLFELWKRDEYFPLVFTREAVERAARHRLELLPGSAQ